MPLTTLPTSRSRRERSARRAAHPRATSVSAADARARRSGGPQDLALYSCACGYAFTAEVSTSVGCPRCGSGQAW